MRSTPYGFCLLLLVGLWQGCGDDAQNLQRPPSEAPAAAAPAPVVPKGRPNTLWDRTKMFFLGPENMPQPGFVDGNIAAYRDPFEPTLVKFVPRVEVSDSVDPGADLADSGGPNGDFGEPPPIDEPQPVATSPTERFKTTDYRVVLIRWGTSVNKALVEDPEGESFVITQDMPLGDNHGRVTDITRYDVIVKEDNREDPVVLSIEPPILKIKEGDELSERLFTNQTTN